MMPFGVRRPVFFLARHPLKVVWGCVVLAVALYVSLVRVQRIPSVSGEPKLMRDGEGPVYYVYPVVVYPEVDPVKHEAMGKIMADGFPSATILGKTGVYSDGALKVAELSALKRHFVIVSPDSNLDFASLVSLELNVSSPRTVGAVSQILNLVRSGRWSEVLLLIVGLIGAYSTVHVLFKNFDRIGSKFSLGCCSLLMASMDLVFALSVINKMGLTIDPLLLIEFGPFFITAVGFRKSYMLARNIYNQRHKKGDTVGLLCGVEESLRPLLLEYLKEISLFALFALSDVKGLHEFSLLCVCMLVADFVLLHTFFLGMIAFRMRLHASRAAVSSHDLENPWKSRAKLIATVILLALYSLNVLSSLSSRMSLDLDLEGIGFSEMFTNAKIYTMPLVSIHDGHFSAIYVMYEIFARLIPGYQVTNLKHVLQVSFSLALPISLLFNYYLYRLLRTRTRPIEPKPVIPLPSDSVIAEASDEQIVDLIESGKIPLYSLERILNDSERGVTVRRRYIEEQLSKRASNQSSRGLSGQSSTGLSEQLPKGSSEQPSKGLSGLPCLGYEYDQILGRNCENVVGYVPVPVGVAGPIRVDGSEYYVPMSTTEGALVASTSRGCKATSYGGGVTTALLDDGMTRGPVVKFPTLEDALQLCNWISANFESLSQVFNGSSRFVVLQKIDTRVVGRLVYLRFKAKTGDAMGMNMISKSSQSALSFLQHEFPLMRVIALSGNFCSDKKSAAVNWVDGRGKSVTAEAFIPAEVVESVLKSNVAAMVEVNTTKNLVGSMVAGSSGSGCNAHAANVVSAMFIALGQDPAQVVTSASCLTLMECCDEALYVSCTMPCIEVGTVGGGTVLSAQRACLEMLGLEVVPEGERAALLARLIVATVLAGEISLIASLSEGTLVKAHQTLNQSRQ
ncbi:3-hydroxy-3-methylglutaryl coenzyme A reductase [Paramicrosporidium saccamoebae]|uniref:3-hydroxy-3-methylglutaryl coenzyme A reductase n=1 Tax=Paramicrosporidium saccamoebae TaxID=1246581 RepID=A0A2H9TQJ4_9FUNG|nr:3-hydroxy-3-methylglutaryl coenzyme A reductase [Paramicrosporidium saccamoebae]